MHSEYGRGAEFWVDLPLTPADVVSDVSSVSGVPRTPVTSEIQPGVIRVLIAEDNPVNQKLALRLLEKRGVHADVAANGSEAVDRCKGVSYDLILMDCQMPNLDGFEATRRIRQSEMLSPRVPIIAVTAHASGEEHKRCLLAGMDDVLTKPFQPSQLDGLLEKWLPARRQMTQARLASHCSGKSA